MVLLLLVAGALHQILEAPHRYFGGNAASILGRQQRRRGAARRLLVGAQERCQVAEPELAHRGIHRVQHGGVEAGESARIQIGVLIVDAADVRCRAKAGGLPDRRNLRFHFPAFAHHGWAAGGSAAIAAAMLETRQQIGHGVVFLAQQADGVVLLDAPIVECEGEAFARLEHEAHRAIAGLLGLQVRAALGGALQRIPAVDHVLAGVAAVVGGVDAGVIVAGVLAGNDALVHRHQVRRPKRLRPRCAEVQRVRYPPAAGQLAHHRVADVREVLVAGRGLHIDALEQRDLELAKQRRHVAAAAVVWRRAGVDDIGHEREGVAFVVDESDGAVQARVAVVLERFAPVLQTGNEAHGAGGHHEQIAPVDFEVGEEQFHFAVAAHIHQRSLQIAVRAAAERVVGRRRRIGQRLGHQRVGDAIPGHVFPRCAREQCRRLPVPGAAAAAETLQQPKDSAVVIHHARYFREAIVVDQDVQSFVRHTSNQVRRQPVGGSHRAEWIVVVSLVDQ